MAVDDEHEFREPGDGGGEHKASGAGQADDGKGLKGHLKKNWIFYSLGIGGATLLVAFLALRSNSNSQAASMPTGSTSGVPGMTPDSMNSDSLNSMMQGLVSLENQNSQVLQQLANAPTTGAGTNPTGGSTWTATPTPAAKNTSGLSNNFWVYTTKAGDTLDSITKMAGWTPQQQVGGGPGFLYNYRNNASIFSSLGINNPSQANTPLPVGYQISL